MTRKIINQNSFVAGEITPRLYSRSETDEYQKGLEVCTNAFVTPHGPVVRRSGSQFIAQVKDNTETVKLIRYQFSKSLAFILEFGNTYIRFYTNQGQVVESAKTITGITAANPGVVTSTAHGYSNGDQVYIESVSGMTEVNNSSIPYQVANVTANTFELNDTAGNNVDTSGYTAYSSGGTAKRIYTLTSPWNETEVQSLQYVQRGSTMYIVHPDYQPRTLVRTSNTDWTLDTLDLFPEPTYESGYENTGTTVTPAATTGTGVNFTAGTSIFLDGDVGRQIVNLSDGETGVASIVSVTSGTVAVCDIITDFTDTNAIASADWKMDLSPVVDLEIDKLQAGAIANIRSEYTAGSLGSRFTITGVTKASPGVVTTSASHGYSNGDKVQIQDIVGMTQINDKIFTVDGVTSTTFQLKGEDTSGYTTYSSGGIVRKKLDDIAIDAFRSADVGKYILMNGGVCQIVTVNGADDIDVEILKSLNDKDTTGNWTLEVPTWDSTRGYPKSVGLYQDRLVFGGTTQQPQTIWMSETGILDGFGIGPDDEDAIDIDLSSNQVNEISWIASSRDLVVGTSGGELTLSGGGSNAITPSNIQQQVRTYHGSDTQQIEVIREEILFIQNSARKVRTFRYDFNIDGYTGEDLTFLAEHITEDNLAEIAYAQEPDTILYAVTDAGELLAGTYDRPKKVIAWTRFQTDGDFENVQTISTSTESEVWVVVERKVNGSTVRYIELFTNQDGTDDADGFSDCHLKLTSNIPISGITAANPAVVTTSGAHGLVNGDTVIIKDLVDPEVGDLDSTLTNMSSLNGGIYTVANKTSTTFELTTSGGSNVNTTNYNAYGSGGNCWKRVTAISGLQHLEGRTVQIRGDGAVITSETVSSGAITLDTAAGEVVVGLPYTTTIKTLNHEYQLNEGSMQGQRVRWSRPLLRVYKSTVPTLNGEFLPSRNAADLMTQKVPLYSGFLEYGPLNWANTTALTIATSDPLPLMVLGITGTIDAGVK